MASGLPEIRKTKRRMPLTPALVIGLLICAAESASTAVAPKIGITEGAVDNSGNVSLEITLVAANQSIAAVQFDLQYQPDFSGIFLSAAAEATNAGKKTWTGELAPGVIRALVVGLNQTVIADGPLVTLRVQMKPAIPARRYPLVLKDVVAVDTAGSVVVMEASGGAAIVPGGGVTVPAVRGVANAASYQAGAIAPGEIVAIGGISLAEGTLRTLVLDAAGSATTLLGATRVLFDGSPAPILYTMANQVSAIVPYRVERQKQTLLQVEWQGIRSVPVALPVTNAAPGIFTTAGSGVGQGAVVNEDGAINGSGNPASLGSVVAIYATGEGQTAPPGTDGSIITPAELCRPVLPVSVTIGGQNAEVLYAGSAGDQIAGLFQVNARIPTTLAPAVDIPVILTVGGNHSQGAVTIAVR